jgi:cytoskeletal protein CcmA (bactofilin family)
MWGDRKPPEGTSRATADLNRPEAPAESIGRNAAVDRQGIAFIGKSMTVKGQIRSAEHMHIAGEVDGPLQLAGYDLMLTADSSVRGDVTAREVDISGSIQGNVDATRKITVRKGGKLIGDLRTPGIVIEDGAYFKGNIEIVNSEVRESGDDATSPVTPSTTTDA